MDCIVQNISMTACSAGGNGIKLVKIVDVTETAVEEVAPI